MAAISARTGLPVTSPLAPAFCAAAPSKPHSTPEAIGDSSRVDSSESASEFISTSGTPSVLAAMPAGTAT